MDPVRELAVFLRTRRERLDPVQLGLPVRAHRRTHGLRREEVAEQAGLSVDYVVRLEQGRGARPSPSVVEALARTLRLSPDERAHLFDLAGHRVPQRGPAANEETSLAQVDRVVQALSPTPAMLLNHRFDVVGWNPECAVLLIDFGALSPAWRNIPRLGFLHPYFRDFFLERELVMRQWTAFFRAVVAARANDLEVAELLKELMERSGEFRGFWELGEVGVYRSSRRKYLHPRFGAITVNTEVLVPSRLEDHRIIVHIAADRASQTALDVIASEVSDRRLSSAWPGQRSGR
jgi:transcriptional regulator with XRE-family HTH domain